MGRSPGVGPGQAGAYKSDLGCKAGQGRPLGLLMHYLCMADPGSRFEHVRIKVSLEDREAARQYLKDLPGSEVLFAKERDRRTDAQGNVVEPEEPPKQP